MKEMLCRAKLPPKLGIMRTWSTASTARAGFKRCGKSRCPMCPFTGEAADGRTLVNEALISSTKTTMTLKHSMTCQTGNCIYLLTCCKDGKQYVGETGRTVAKRFAEHRDSMHQQATSKPVGQHFQEAGHRLEADDVMLPIIYLKTENVG